MAASIPHVRNNCVNEEFAVFRFFTASRRPTGVNLFNEC